MSQIRLYVDEDARHGAVVAGLLRHGIDVLTVADVNLFRKSDEEQLIWAANADRVLYSLNVKDFTRLHFEFLATGRSHSGIIVIPKQRYSIGGKIRHIKQFIDVTSAEAMRNQLVFL